MSLAEALSDIAKRMEEEANCCDDEDTSYRLRSYAFQIQTLAKLAPTKEPQQEVPGVKILQDQRKRRDQEFEQSCVRMEEGSKVAWAEGGPHDGLLMPISPQMPIGAKTHLGGAIYELTSPNTLKYIPST